MITPYRDEVLIKIYRCPICEAIWLAQTGLVQISCAVPHPPGTCCHFGEKPLSQRELEAIQAILSEER